MTDILPSMVRCPDCGARCEFWTGIKRNVCPVCIDTVEYVLSDVPDDADWQEGRDVILEAAREASTVLIADHVSEIARFCDDDKDIR